MIKERIKEVLGKRSIARGVDRWCFRLQVVSTMNYSTQKCSIKKSLSGTSYLLRKFRAYILIKPFNVYLKTLNTILFPIPNELYLYCKLLTDKSGFILRVKSFLLRLDLGETG